MYIVLLSKYTYLCINITDFANNRSPTQTHRVLVDSSLKAGNLLRLVPSADIGELSTI